jgi:hypothetical protein
VAPGVCYRLWAEHEQHHLIAHSSPEILEADLAPLALELAAFGVEDPARLRWLDEPPAAAYAQARELLMELGALESASGSATRGRVTPRGRRMAGLPLHPRLAHKVVEAETLGALSLACDLAALLSERDPIRGHPASPPDADIESRLGLVRGRAHTLAPGQTANGDALRRIRAESARLRMALGGQQTQEPERAAGADDTSAAGILVAFAYPDRIGQLRTPRSGRFLLRNGNGAALSGAQSLSDCHTSSPPSRWPPAREPDLFAGGAGRLAELERPFKTRSRLTRITGCARGAAAARERNAGAIKAAERPLRQPDPDVVTAVLLDGVRQAGVDALPWTDGARTLRRRLAFLHRVDASWPDVSDAALYDTLGAWLGPHLGRARSLADIARVDLAGALLATLPWDRRAAIEELAPTHIVVPSGSRIPIDYSDASAPVLAVRLQELFGMADTPRIARGAVPLTVHLLSPAHRPVQVTRDLAGFWRTSYFDVRKEMRGATPTLLAGRSHGRQNRHGDGNRDSWLAACRDPPGRVSCHPERSERSRLSGKRAEPSPAGRILAALGMTRLRSPVARRPSPVARRPSPASRFPLPASRFPVPGLCRRSASAHAPSHGRCRAKRNHNVAASPTDAAMKRRSFIQTARRRRRASWAYPPHAPRAKAGHFGEPVGVAREDRCVHRDRHQRRRHDRGEEPRDRHGNENGAPDDRGGRAGRPVAAGSRRPGAARSAIRRAVHRW